MLTTDQIILKLDDYKLMINKLITDFHANAYFSYFT